MKIEKLSEIKNILDNAVEKYSSICILTHKNPDGDGLCASLALQELLLRNNKKADIILEVEAPDTYDFLQGFQRTKVFSQSLIYELIIILDCHEKERIGICAPLLFTAKKVIAIDHHIERDMIPEADTYIDTKITSVGAILFNMYEKEIKDIPEKSSNYIAKAMYTTIINDTDNFLNSNINAETFDICSKLMKYNIFPGNITEKFIYNKPVNQIIFVGEVLSSIRTFNNDQVLFMGSNREMLRRNRLGNEATTKLTRWVKGTRNVKVTICYQEINKNLYRLSLRSNFIDVNRIATKYGGGGHQKASGCEIKENLENIIEMILNDIREQLDN